MAHHNFELDEKILIELHNGRVLECNFLFESADSIRVKNTKDLATGKLSKNTQAYYKAEIKSVLPVNGPSASASSNENKSNSQATERKRGIRKSVVKKTFTDVEIEQLQNSTKMAMYISQYNDKYYEALENIMRQKIIAVNSEGAFGRLDPKRSLISISTSNHVYLFDMLLLGRMKKEFKRVFSSDSPRKIVHSSAEIADYLKHIEDCSLNNAFDTLMVHFSLKQTIKRINLQECFEEYFNLPDDFPLQNFNYQARQLSQEAKVRSALNVLLLVELYWFFNDILMKPLHIATQQFSETYKNVENQVDLMTHMNNGEYPGAQQIDTNAVADLEEHFEQLNAN